MQCFVHFCKRQQYWNNMTKKSRSNRCRKNSTLIDMRHSQKPLSKADLLGHANGTYTKTSKQTFLYNSISATSNSVPGLVWYEVCARQVPHQFIMATGGLGYCSVALRCLMTAWTTGRGGVRLNELSDITCSTQGQSQLWKTAQFWLSCFKQQKIHLEKKSVRTLQLIFSRHHLVHIGNRHPISKGTNVLTSASTC